MTVEAVLTSFWPRRDECSTMLTTREKPPRMPARPMMAESSCTREEQGGRILFVLPTEAATRGEADLGCGLLLLDSDGDVKRGSSQGESNVDAGSIGYDAVARARVQTRVGRRELAPQDARATRKSDPSEGGRVVAELRATGMVRSVQGDDAVRATRAAPARAPRRVG